MSLGPVQQTFVEMLIAAMKDAALEGKVTQFQTMFDPTEQGKRPTKMVRFIVLPEERVYLTPDEIKAKVAALKPIFRQDENIHYTHGEHRVVIVNEAMTFGTPPDVPFGTPDNTKSN